jgi:hypothetical protein
LAICVLFGGCFDPDEDTTDTDVATEGGSGTSSNSSTTSPTDPTNASMTSTDPSGTMTSGDESTTGTVDDSTGDATTGPALEPEIEVTIAGQPLASGDSFAIPNTFAVGASSPAVVVTVENTGDGDLLVGGVVPQMATDAGQFTVVQDALSATIAPGDTSDFSVAFAPENGGIQSVTLQIGSNDADEAQYALTFTGHTTPNTYRNLMPAMSPSPRFNAAIADIEGDRLLLFGGRNNAGDRLDDTWVFDVVGNTWTELMPPVSPSIRDAHEMAYLGDDTVMLFGGNDQQGSTAPGFGDTWLFDTVAETWSQLVVPGPPARFQHMMVSIGTSALLFGGRSGGSEVADTWIFDGALQTWTNTNATGAPPPRITAALAWNGTNTVTLYGGFFQNSPLADTRNYSIVANSWGPPNAGGAPGARGVLEGEYLAAGQMVVFSGKLDTCCDDPDPGTFAYDPVANSWVNLAPPAEPPPRYNYSMSAVEGRNKAILFGGQTLNGGPGSAVAQTFEYVGPLP